MSCGICERLGASPDEAVVYADEEFIAFSTADVPGWITVATRRHVEGMDGLDDAQAPRLGDALRRTMGAVRQATGAERVHAVYLGEHARHCHFWLFPRHDGQPPLFGNERLIAEIGDFADPGAAASVRAAIRDALMG